jgi:quercetin dioxygenase-like cupin family protein
MKKRPPADLPEFVRDAASDDGTALAEALAELSRGQKAPPQLLRERLLSTVLRPRLRFAPFYGALGALFDLNDSELASVFERAANPDEWSPAPVPSTALLHLQGGPRVVSADNGLVRIAAGAAFPRHRHLGPERVLVLQGGYRDEPSGKVYRAGDWHEMPADSTHAYVALPDGELLLAVSLSGGVDVDGYGMLTPGG